MIKPKGDKQVEYLDLDLDSGKSTPPRKVGETSFRKYRAGQKQVCSCECMKHGVYSGIIIY